MVQTINNPFQTVEIYVPTEQHDAYKRYCLGAESGGTGSRSYDKSPFLRMVDMWYLAVCLAVKDGRPPDDLGKQELTEINKGVVFAEYPDMVYTLMLIAVQISGDHSIVARERDMIKIVNGLASAGMPKLLQMLEEGQGEAIWNLSGAIHQLLVESD